MKMFKTVLFLVPLAVAAFVATPESTDLTTLWGGSAYAAEMPDPQDTQDTKDPVPAKKYNCDSFCGGASQCSTVDCHWVGDGVCSQVTKEFSGKCEEAEDGVLTSCTTGSANDHCYKDYRTRCTEERIACSTYHSGCGTKYECR